MNIRSNSDKAHRPGTASAIRPVYPRAGRDRSHARVIPVVSPGMTRAELARRLV